MAATTVSHAVFPRLREIARSEPRLAMVTAFRELESAAAEVLLSRGVDQGSNGNQPSGSVARRATEVLIEEALLPPSTTDIVELVEQARDTAVHATPRTSPTTARRYVDLVFFLADRFRELAAQPPSEPAATG